MSYALSNALYASCIPLKKENSRVWSDRVTLAADGVIVVAAGILVGLAFTGSLSSLPIGVGTLTSIGWGLVGGSAAVVFIDGVVFAAVTFLRERKQPSRPPIHRPPPPLRTDTPPPTIIETPTPEVKVVVKEEPIVERLEEAKPLSTGHSWGSPQVFIQILKGKTTFDYVIALGSLESALEGTEFEGMGETKIEALITDKKIKWRRYDYKEDWDRYFSKEGEKNLLHRRKNAFIVCDVKQIQVFFIAFKVKKDGLSYEKAKEALVEEFGSCMLDEELQSFLNDQLQPPKKKDNCLIQ